MLLKIFLFLSISIYLLRAEDTLTEDEAKSISTAFSEDDLKAMEDAGESKQFETEVSRLMEIIINSLYKTRDIFLRELISNANDAIDKIRYRSLTNPDALSSKPELEVKIQANKDAGTITILDSGIGMTKEELAKNLGTVAHSGTASFLDKYAEASKDQDPMQLIGQFGVGFYSAFLVADEVIVASKSNDDDQYIWKSKADGKFTIVKDPRGNTLGRGTEITLKIKEDAQNFLESSEIEKTVKRYSEFIQYPIYLYSTKTESEEIDLTEDEIAEMKAKKKKEKSEGEADGEDGENKDDLDVEDEEEDDTPKTKTIEKKVNYWNRLNKNKPIWSRKPSQIEETEYNEFYKAVTRDGEDPLSYTHFKTDGEIEFSSILFIPSKAPQGMYEQYYNQKSTMKLYVRRVLVADEFEDIVPRYLNFLQGLVDSNDLPLNVNREDLQKSKVMTLISRKLTRKALDMLKKLAQADEPDEEDEIKTEEDDNTKKEENDDVEEPKDEEEEKKLSKDSKYLKFWNEFGKSIKLGYLEDTRNKKRLLDLLRFPTSKSTDKPISLQNYIDNMKPGQKYIYTISAGSIDEANNSPFMERMKKKDLEVIYFVDNLDEYLQLREYDDYEFQAITKDGVEVDNKKMKEYLKEKDEEFEDLKTWLKTAYGNKISRVQISSTLVDSPMAVGTAKYGYSANMARIARNQAFGSKGGVSTTKILEINYRHPIILELKKRVENGEGEGENNELKDLANLLLDVALIRSDFPIEADEHESFSGRVLRIVQNGLSIDKDAKLEPEPEFAQGLDVDSDAEDDEEEEDDAEDLDSTTDDDVADDDKVDL